MNAVSILCLSLLLSFAAAGKPPPKPPPPSLNDTFIGSGTVRIDLGERNITGTFTIARWHEMQQGVENEMYPSPSQKTTSKALLRYDKNTTFYIRGEADNPLCFSEDRHFNNMSRFWEWLDIAEFLGNYIVDKKNYSFWGITHGGVQFEFGKPNVPPKKSEVIYFFNRKSEISVFYTFTSYTPMTAAQAAKDKDFPKLFDIPDFCS